MTRFWSKSLMVRLIVSFLFLSVLTVGLVATIAYWRANELLEQSVIERLDAAATYKEQELDLWIKERRQDIHTIASSPQIRQQANILLNPQTSESNPLATSAYDLISAQLNTLIIGKPDLQEIFILNGANGQVILSTNPSHEGEYQDNAKYFSQGLLTTFVQNVYPAPETEKPIMTLVTPLLNESGQRLGVLAIHLNLERMDAIISGRAGLGKSGETYLIDRKQRFVSGERFGREKFAEKAHSVGIDAALEQHKDGFGLYQNYAGVPVIGVYRWIEDRELALLAEMHQQEAFAPAQRLARTILLIGLVSTLTLAISVYWLARQIAKPILAIADTASRVAKGDLTQTAPVLTQDEIGVLARAFNQMIEQLRDLLNTLERRVAARTRDLQIAADVAKQITTVLDIDELLLQVVTLTVKGFDLYGCHVYLLDPSTQTLVQQTGADAQGNKLVAQDTEKNIPLDSKPSIIALAARTRQAVIVNDTTQSNIYLAGPSFADTRSELAIPMIQGRRLLGVFDLQSEMVNRFSQEDLRVLTTLAEQTAIAVGNAQLFTKVQTARLSAEQASRAKSTFLSVISHELHTPLTSVLGFAKIIKKRLDDVIFPQIVDSDNAKVQRSVRQVKSNINIIVSEGERLKALINNVLDLAEIESGRVEWCMETVSMQTVIERAAAAMTTLLENQPLTFKIDPGANLPPIIGDHDRLTQVIVNLISNAIKFTDEGLITCRARQVDDEIQVSISDTGIGIAPDDQQRVFEQFVQAGDPLTDRPGGTGLGLSICKNIIEHHGGRIWVQSEMGVGSTFTFALPLYQRNNG